MIFLTTVTNAVKQVLNNKKIRIITATLFGPDDVKSAPECGPAGYDGSPIAGLTAVFAKTGKRGSTVFIGYVPTNQLAEPGEARIYATDANGVEKAKIWAHNNGTVEIGGTSSVVNPNHLTQYEALNTALQNELTNLVAKLNLIAAAVNAIVPGSVVVPIVVTQDFSTAKATKLLIE